MIGPSLSIPLPAFSYVGRYRYVLTFVAHARPEVFVERSIVDLVLTQILRAGSEKGFADIAHCFMPDHLHIVVEGQSENSDCKAFIKAAKQYSGFYYSQLYGRRLWDRYGHDRVIRDDMELALTVRYLLANPLRAGLVERLSDYPFLGSERYAIYELLQWCESPEELLKD